MGGRMVDFGGWDMPVQYPAGTIEEHLRTRTHSGLFDVSHMGEIDVRGPDAIRFVNRLTSNDVTKLVDGQAQYSALTTPEGTVVEIEDEPTSMPPLSTSCGQSQRKKDKFRFATCIIREL